MPYGYVHHTDKTWSQLEQLLADCFDKWGVREWEARSAGRMLRTAKYSEQDETTRAATVEWRPRGAADTITLTLSEQARAVDNLAVLVIGIDQMRLNEKRGLTNVMQQAYLQLAAPPRERDPYEVLGVRRDSPREVLEASYKALAKSRHPDAGGSDEAMAELNAAYERIKAEGAA